MNHSHYLYDSDPHFKIDPITRKIINNSSSKITLIQYDHNSERFTFEVPRHIEGHDLMSCNMVEIHYVNVESNTKVVRAGVYTVDDLQVSEDDEDTVVCSWIIPNNATQLVGQLQFLIRFACVNNDTGVVEYVWNTAVYTGISVSSGIYNANSSSDNIAPAFNFVTTISGQVLKFFVGTKAEYDALSFAQKEALFAIITDDTTKEDFFQRMDAIDADYDQLTSDVAQVRSDIDDIVSGETVVSEATHANAANTANALNYIIAATPLNQEFAYLTDSGIYAVVVGSAKSVKHTEVITIPKAYFNKPDIEIRGDYVKFFNEGGDHPALMAMQELGNIQYVIPIITGI